MHENRETSKPPRSRQDRDRAAKAERRTAAMHGLEGSDCAGVTVNRPNNGALPSAEVGEERVQTKENTAHSRTRPTQRGACGSQELRGVRKAAQYRKQERFSALLHHRAVDLLRGSFFALKWKAPPGVDGVTWQHRPGGSAGRFPWAGAAGRGPGRSPLGESTSRRPTVDRDRWASRRWRIRLSSRPW